MPGSGLDPSWVLSLSEAVHKNFIFGRDIIFTYGPYAAVSTKMYHPATDSLALFGGLYIAISYLFVFVYISKQAPWYLSLAFIIFLTGSFQTMDGLLYSYVLSVGLACYRTIQHNNLVADNKLNILKMILFFSPLGLLPLIKVSSLFLCIVVVILACCLCVTHLKILMALFVAVTPVLTMTLFWGIANQHISDLPNFLYSTLPIVSGYTEAMSANGPFKEIIVYLIASFFLLKTVINEKSINYSSKSILFLMCFVFIFVTFKLSFVRHDGHALMGSGFIVLMTLLFCFVLKTKQMSLVVLLSLLVWIIIDRNYIETSPKSFINHIESFYMTSWYGLRDRYVNPNQLHVRFKDAMTSLKEEMNFPLLDGTVDLYFINQAYLIASSNVWNPRPVFQSYSAYKPFLIEKNYNHLLGPYAPDYIFLKLETIDNRIPSLDDGKSWPELLTHYKPIDFKNNFLYLKKSYHQDTVFQSIGHGTYALKEFVSVPNSSTPIFAEISIKPNILGILAKVLFKTSRLKII